jgi:phenylalanyl-tRNA synthetase beta chain
MRFTLSWLKDHLETTASVTEIAEKLVNLGLEALKIRLKNSKGLLSPMW